MAVLFQGASGPVTAITNYYSAGGVNSAFSLQPDPDTGTVEILSGALTANTLKTLYTKTGRGRINVLTAQTKNATSRTVRLRLTIDGTVCFDATTNAIADTGRGLIAVGIYAAGGFSTVFQPIDYQESCLVEVASSLTETDFVALGINAEEWAA